MTSLCLLQSRVVALSHSISFLCIIHTVCIPINENNAEDHFGIVLVDKIPGVSIVDGTTTKLVDVFKIIKEVHDFDDLSLTANAESKYAAYLVSTNKVLIVTPSAGSLFRDPEDRCNRALIAEEAALQVSSAAKIQRHQIQMNGVNVDPHR